MGANSRAACEKCQCARGMNKLRRNSDANEGNQTNSLTRVLGIVEAHACGSVQFAANNTNAACMQFCT